MKKNGFAPLIIILVITVLVVVGLFGYLGYKNRSSRDDWKKYDSVPSFVSSPTSEAETKLSVTGVSFGQKVTIDVKETTEAIGTMMVLPGWQITTSSNVGKEMVGESAAKSINIQNGDYSIQITSFGSGRAVCGTDNGKRSSLIDGYVNFKDQNGTEYFRQENQTIQNILDVCSDGVTGKGSDSFGSGEAVFGNISYTVPTNPKPEILNEMDNMLASFKTN